VGTTTLSIPFAKAFNKKAFERWLQDSARKQAERQLFVKSVDYSSATRMIRLVVKTEEVTLVKKICDFEPFSGEKLNPNIESVERNSATASPQYRMEQTLKLLVQERYNTATASFNLDGVAHHVDDARRIEWNNAVSGKALCTILQRFCTGCKELILDNNDISNLSLFNGIARACPTIDRLSVAGNKIKEFTQFRFINNLRLRALRISGNPIADLDSKMRLEEAKKYFPRLEMLDELQTNPVRFFDPTMAVDGVPLCELPQVQGSLIPPDLAPIAQGFVSNYMSYLTNPATPIEQIAAMYDTDAFMSISLSPDLRLKQSSAVSKLLNFNRNLARDSSLKCISEYMFYGSERISQAIKNIPTFTIPPEMLVCDAIDLTPFSSMAETKSAGLRFVQLCFCGNSSFQDEHFSFRRVFTLLVMAERVVIRNDMLTILPELGKNLALDTSMVMDASNREELVDKLAAEGRIVPSIAREALQNCQWNYQASLQMVITMRQQGRIPANLCT